MPQGTGNSPQLPSLDVDANGDIGVFPKGGSFPAGRPSQASGRTYVALSARNQTASANFRTTTPGKVLYVTSMWLVVINTSTTAPAEVTFGSGGGVSSPVGISVAAATASAGSSQTAFATIEFDEPYQCPINIGGTIWSGTAQYAAGFVGYEE